MRGAKLFLSGCCCAAKKAGNVTPLAGEIIDIIRQGSAGASATGAARIDQKSSAGIHRNSVLDENQPHVTSKPQGVLAEGPAKAVLELVGLVIPEGGLVAWQSV